MMMPSRMAITASTVPVTPDSVRSMADVGRDSGEESPIPGLDGEPGDSGQRSRHEYRLTDKGLDLYPVLVALMHWGDRYAAEPAGAPVVLQHRDCGEPVQLQLTCGAGHVMESARDVTPVPGPGARKIA